jgi:hypothetical protein
MNRCPTCGRGNARARTRDRNAVPTLQLSLDLQQPNQLPKRPSGPSVRMVRLDCCPNAEGEPRHALLIPGRRLPLVFHTIAAALAAKVVMEASR